MTDPKAALHDLLNGRIRRHDRQLRHFTEPDWQRYADLLTGAFLLAIRRRFRPGQDRAPIIRFVATVRERYDHTGHDLDPVIAEALIWAALGETDPSPTTSPMVTAQTLLVLGLLEDEGMPPSELDEFLTTADTLTRPFEAEPAADPSSEPVPEPAAESGSDPVPEAKPEPGSKPGTDRKAAGV